jgi:hypothetical protein
MFFRTWRPVRRGSLCGFLVIEVPSLGMALDDIAVHQMNGKRWAALPAHAMIGPDGETIRDERGKVRYAARIRWLNHSIANRFSDRVIALLLEHEPRALDAEGQP